jgi:hypothetical protein
VVKKDASSTGSLRACTDFTVFRQRTLAVIGDQIDQLDQASSGSVSVCAATLEGGWAQLEQQHFHFLHAAAAASAVCAVDEEVGEVGPPIATWFALAPSSQFQLVWCAPVMWFAREVVRSRGMVRSRGVAGCGDVARS